MGKGNIQGEEELSGISSAISRAWGCHVNIFEYEVKAYLLWHNQKKGLGIVTFVVRAQSAHGLANCVNY